MQCQIQFLDRELDRFRWCKLDETGAQDTDCGSAEVEQLASVCANAGKVIVFLPQQNVLLTSAQLPPRASKQQLNAIAFAVEDQLAQDVDECFFANLPQQEDGTVPLAIIEREIMDDIVRVLNQHHVNARAILPAAYLCPWTRDDEDLLASVCPCGEGYLIRFGQHLGVFSGRSLLSGMLNLLSRRQSAGASRVALYCDDLPEYLDLPGLDVRLMGDRDPLMQLIDQRAGINLKQKDYQSHRAWLEMLKNWQWPAVAALLLTFVFLASGFIDLWDKGRERDELIARQQQLLARYLPDIEASDSPKRQLIEVLSRSQDGSGQAGFLDMLYEYAHLKTGVNDITTERILYQKASLIVSLESNNLKSMETLREKLQQSSYSTEIENVNINPDKTTGRLVMRAE